MPDWHVLFGALARAQGPILTEKDRVWLRCVGVLDLLVEVARGNEFALQEIEKFEYWAYEFIRLKIEEGDIDPEAVAGALIVSLPRGVLSDTELYFEFLVKEPEPALPPAVLFALQRFPVYRAKWKSLGMHDVGAIEFIGAQFNKDDGDDFDDEFYQLALEAQAGGHLWAVLFCLINCMAQAFFPGDRHFPSVVTQEYFAKAVEAFAIVVDFRVFTNAVRDLFTMFFALLIHAFSAEELPLIGFTLPYAGGNMANKFCRQVLECGPIAEVFCWKLLGTPNYLFGATTVPRDIFDRLANERPLGVYYTRDYLRYGWRFATAFNLLDDPSFFLKWLRHFWEEAQVGEEAEDTEGLPIRKNFKSFELDGIRLFFRRFLARSPGCAFSLGTIRCIPGAMTFESPVKGFTLADLACFLDFADGSKKGRASAFAAMIFALNEQKGPFPIELITQIFSQAFPSLGEFLHLNRRTPLDYVHAMKAQRQDSLLLTARCDLQQAELERVAVETELEQQKGLVAQLLEENEKRASLVAELVQERDERALRGEKRAASGEAENPPAPKVHRPPEFRQVALAVTNHDIVNDQGPSAEHGLCGKPPVVLEHEAEKQFLVAHGEKRLASDDELNPRASRKPVKVTITYSTKNQGPPEGGLCGKPPVALDPEELPPPSMESLATNQHDLGDDQLFFDAPAANSSDGVNASSSGDESSESSWEDASASSSSDERDDSEDHTFEG